MTKKQDTQERLHDLLLNRVRLEDLRQVHLLTGEAKKLQQVMTKLSEAYAQEFQELPTRTASDFEVREAFSQFCLASSKISDALATVIADARAVYQAAGQIINPVHRQRQQQQRAQQTA